MTLCLLLAGIISICIVELGAVTLMMLVGLWVVVPCVGLTWTFSLLSLVYAYVWMLVLPLLMFVAKVMVLVLLSLIRHVLRQRWIVRMQMCRVLCVVMLLVVVWVRIRCRLPLLARFPTLECPPSIALRLVMDTLVSSRRSRVFGLTLLAWAFTIRLVRGARFTDALMSRLLCIV